jgi:hypothetical protein
MGLFPVLLLATTLAQASTVGTNAQDKTKAQSLLGEGATLYERGDYYGALGKFNAAYDVYPSSKILFNIGQTKRLLGRPLDALEAYQRFLDEATNASKEERTDAQAWLDRLKSTLGQINVLCQIDGAEIAVDGKTIGKSPVVRPVWSTPGRHQVTAVKSGECPMVDYAEVPAGGQATAVLRPLHGPLGADGPKLDLAESSKSTAEPASNGWWLGRRWTWVAGGATVALTGAAAIVGLSMRSRFDDLRSSCGKNSPQQAGCSAGDIDSLHTRKVTANVLWGLAGAAAVTTGVLFFVEGRAVTVTPVVGSTSGAMARVEF